MIDQLAKIGFGSTAMTSLKPLDAPQNSIITPISAVTPVGLNMSGQLSQDTFTSLMSPRMHYTQNVGAVAQTAFAAHQQLNTSVAAQAAFRGDQSAKRQLDVVV